MGCFSTEKLQMVDKGGVWLSTDSIMNNSASHGAWPPDFKERAMETENTAL